MGKKSPTQGLRTWVEINTKAIKKNYDIFRGVITPNCKLMSVVKSNAYGHGLIEFSNEVTRLGTDWFGVDSIVEGLTLRNSGITQPILVLGHTLDERITEAVTNSISITVTDFISLKNAVKNAKKNTELSLRIHIKIDSGMGRQGFMFTDMPEVLRILNKKNSGLIVEGLYTHFATAKNPAFPAQTNEQIKLFQKWVDAFKEKDITPIIHASATSGTLLYPHTHFDMVRVGIGMYGLWPSPEVRAARQKNAPLEPVLTWKTRIASIKELPKGSGVGYDLTEVCTKKTRTAILPTGYWHGYKRNLSSIGSVLINGTLARILGKISMDMIVVDVTNHKDIKINDEVVLIGRQKNSTVSASDMASLAETINYEIVTCINPRTKRIMK